MTFSFEEMRDFMLSTREESSPWAKAWRGPKAKEQSRRAERVLFIFRTLLF
jgi:hypothetical protein